MSDYDNWLAAIALHFFTSRDKAYKCATAVAKERKIRWEDALVSIFDSLPAKLKIFYVLIQDSIKNSEQILSLMREADYRTSLYYLRVLARSGSYSHLLVDMYDISISNHAENMFQSRAWEAIELGLVERYVVDADLKPLEVTETSAVFRAANSAVALFNQRGKTWILTYPLPSQAGGIRFMGTILIAHFGYLIRHSKPVNIEEYAKSPLFRKPRGIKKASVATEEVMKLYACALGVYADNPEDLIPESSQMEHLRELIEEYRYFAYES